MAPNLKRSRDTGKSRDKAKRKRRPSDTEQLYKTIGKLCGEECDQEILQVTDSMEDCRASSKRVNDDRDVEMGDNHSDDDDFEPKQRTTNSAVKSGRISKPRAKKNEAEFSLQMGMQKAKRFICEALDFGVRAGFLTPKDNKGKILQVSTDLLNLYRKPRNRRQKRELIDSQPQHQTFDDDDDIGGGGKPKKGSPKKRMLKKKKSFGKTSRSRSRSRSKKGAGVPVTKRRIIPPSTFPPNRSDNPDGERSTTGAEGEAEQDEMEIQAKEINNVEDDKKSTKSQKSCKSNVNKHEEEKSKADENDEDNSNDEGSEEEDEEEKK